MERPFTPTSGFSHGLGRLLSFLIVAILLTACSKGSRSSGGAPSASAAASTAAPSAAPPPYIAPAARTSWPVPGGPRLTVLAGQGVGPIRFGATVATIQRHMQAPCELQTPQVCRYFSRALEFALKGGVVTAIRIHRMDRPAGNDATGKARVYGAFHGGIPPDLRLGMLPWAIQQYLGKPKSIEKLPGNPPFHTVELHLYDGLLLEFDKLGENQPILGGIQLEKAPTPK